MRPVTNDKRLGIGPNPKEWLAISKVNTQIPSMKNNSSNSNLHYRRKILVQILTNQKSNIDANNTSSKISEMGAQRNKYIEMFEKQQIKSIVNHFFKLDDAIGVSYYKDNFTIILKKDSDDISDKISEIDAEIYDLYPDYDHEINYIISESVNSAPLSSDRILYTKE